VSNAPNIPLRDRLIVALDLPSVDAAAAMADRLGDSVSFYKVGLSLAFAGGLDLAAQLVAAGKRVFLDVKLLDIGNTVEDAVRTIAVGGYSFLTVHAYPQAMAAAVAGRGDSALKLLAVTVLTSMDDRDLADTGYAATARDLVIRRAVQASEAGIDGIVCSAAEAAAIRPLVRPGMAIVTPGIRPSGSAAGDQKRVTTPADAIAAGADHLVVGRPVLTAPDPRRAAAAILAEIDAALAGR
jgi:orotidine-5'-phosphate decarboxylase